MSVSVLGMRRERRSVTVARSVTAKTPTSGAVAGGSHMPQPYRKTLATPRPQNRRNLLLFYLRGVCNSDGSCSARRLRGEWARNATAEVARHQATAQAICSRRRQPPRPKHRSGGSRGFRLHAEHVSAKAGSHKTARHGNGSVPRYPPRLPSREAIDPPVRLKPTAPTSVMNPASSAYSTRSTPAASAGNRSRNRFMEPRAMEPWASRQRLRSPLSCSGCRKSPRCWFVSR